MTRALVTGATGFIGVRLSGLLLEQGWELACLVRNRFAARHLEERGARLVLGDLGDADSLARAVEGVDVVFHLASLLKMPWKTEFYTVNVAGTRALAQACARARTAPVLVVVSSLAAAGTSPPGKPRTEDQPPTPVSRYGEVKLGAEAAAAEHASELPITVVRPPMVFGAGDVAALPLFRTVKRGLHLVPARSPAELSMVHVDDLAALLVAAATSGERLGSKPGEGIYYAAFAERLSYAELGQRVGRALGRSRTLALHVPHLATLALAGVSELVGRLRDRQAFLNLDKVREAGAGCWTCSPEKARVQLGFSPSRSLDARLAETADAYRQGGWIT